MKSIITNCIGIIALLVLFSCSDDSSEKQNITDKILHFETNQQMNQELIKVIKMNKEEKSTWALSKGFNSYGVQADLFYDNIDPESFKSEEEIIQFIKKSKYIELRTDENNEKSVEIIAGDNDYRYFANNDMVFTVENQAVKIIGESSIFTSIDNLSDLIRIKDVAMVENDADYTIIKPERLSTKSIASCPLEDSNTPRNGSYRLVMEVYAKERYSSNNHTVDVGYKVKSQKLTIFWFSYTTQITYSIDIRAFHNYKTFNDYVLPTATYIEDSGVVNDNSIEDNNSWIISWPNQINADLRWGWYIVNVSTANVSKDFRCGK